MESFGVIVISPLWGVISVQLAIHGVVELTCALLYFFGFLRGQVSRTKNLTRMFKSLALGVLFLALLALGFWLLAYKVDFDWSKVEEAIYGIFAAISAMFMLAAVGGRLRKAKYLATVPGADA